MNKILDSGLREEIDSLLLSGKSVYEVESWCRNHGLQVSATSIKRYALAYLPEWKDTKDSKVLSIAPLSEVDSTAVDDSLKIVLPEIASTEEFNEVISKRLRETVINMATIVNFKVNQYAQGVMSLPKDDVAVLERVVQIFNTVTNKRNEDRASKNIFDVDTALREEEKKISSPGADLKSYLENMSDAVDE